MKYTYLLIVLSLLIALPACDKDKKKLPAKEIAQELTNYSPLPSIKLITEQLKILSINQILPSLSTEPYQSGGGIYRDYFAIGVISAELMMASHTADKVRFEKNFTALSALAATTMLGDIEQESKDQVRRMVRDNSWAELATSMDDLRKKYEAQLWETNSYELYSLMQLGEWSRIQALAIDVLKSTDRMDQSKILLQAEFWQLLLQNMQLVESPDLIAEDYFRLIYDEVIKIEEIQSKAASATLSDADLSSLRTHSAKILELMTK
ncbi:MAG: hypothetical protein CVU49_09120 [Candidatus Cloacimonetes bacterium HGW-Cloacimonetes-2]|jgi:hypothetical protein|nr:MAG: hypothetical protein CVU49_09120 [Candidatus Cloacimonetes bacterium HGW-Cloacimonetes-2]